MSSTPADRARRGTGTDSYDNLEPLFARMAALDPADPGRSRLREQLITAAMPLARHIASRFAGRGESADDLTQVAAIGLVHAVDRFDPAHGAQFVAFAVPTIMGEVRRHFRDRTWAVRVPRPVKELQQRLAPATETLYQRLARMPTARELAAELDADLVEVTQALIARNGYRSEPLEPAAGDEQDGGSSGSVADTLGAPDPNYRLLEDALAVGPLLAALPQRDRQVLVWRFFENETQSQIAQRLGVSQMQVSRILTRVLGQLREQALAERPTKSA